MWVNDLLCVDEQSDLREEVQNSAHGHVARKPMAQISDLKYIFAVHAVGLELGRVPLLFGFCKLVVFVAELCVCLLYTSPSPRDRG
eukprot:6273687-Amphidinium_carterae.1